MARVRFDSGPRTGEAVELNGSKTVFGRNNSCDCVLPHPTVSRHHFFIESVQSKHLLVDDKSGNGTYVNGKPVSWIELSSGDQIRAGPFLLVFESESSSPTSTQAEIDLPTSVAASRYSTEYPREYLVGIDHFNEGRYYDAHEVWEEIWLRSSGVAKLFYQTLIQAAVGLLHYERGNARGAKGMFNNVCERLRQLPSDYMSLDLVEFEKQFRSFFQNAIECDWEGCPQTGLPAPVLKLQPSDRAL
jgi:hypothetical protein